MTTPRKSKPLPPADVCRAAADLLEAHNEWRRGGDGPQIEPGSLGIAIELAVWVLRDHKRPNRTARNPKP